MEYGILIFTFLIISILTAILSFNITLSFDKLWIDTVKNKSVKGDRLYYFNLDGSLNIDGKKTLNFIKSKTKNTALYSNTDYINKFMFVFNDSPLVKVTFIEGYLLDGQELYYTYGYTKRYYESLNRWMRKNGVFKSDEVWKDNRNADWKSFPTPKDGDVNWSKKARIGVLL